MPNSVSHRTNNSMNEGGGRDRTGYDQPDFASRDIHAEARHLRQPLIKRRLGIPETARSACQTAVACFHRPTSLIIPAHVRAVESCLRPLATHLVETPALAVSLVSPLLHVTAGVIMSAAFALIMNKAPIGKQRPMILVRGRKFTKSQVMNQNSNRVGGDFVGTQGY
jgi:hypothetical protein